MSEMERLAACPFCGVQLESTTEPVGDDMHVTRTFWQHPSGSDCFLSVMFVDDDPTEITAWNTRQHATALEIGRGIGREEAAAMHDNRAAECEEKMAGASHGMLDHFTRMEQWHAASAEFIRAASPALDVEGMVEIGAKAIDELHDRFLPDDISSDMESRAVLASLGIKNG